MPAFRDIYIADNYRFKVGYQYRLLTLDHKISDRQIITITSICLLEKADAKWTIYTEDTKIIALG